MSYQFKMQVVVCSYFKEFMKTQLAVIARHLDEHKYLRKIEDKDKALDSFIQDYGWLIREMYCTTACPYRVECKIALQLSASGDLLRDKLPK